ncbi:hypothetical protein ABPG72_011758 [Tetrahymena utriculariae]
MNNQSLKDSESQDFTNQLDIQGGLPWTKKNENIEKHPVQTIQEMRLYGQEEAKMKMYSNLYGSQFPMMLTIERNILAKPSRLPGEKQSLLGLDIMMNRLNQIEFEDFLGTDNPEMHKLNAHERFLKSFD